MNQIARAFIILTAIAFVCPALSQADIVYIKNEDKLIGTIQSPAFSVQTPYGKIRLETEFLKSISFKDGSTGHWVIKTINNDQFSGTLLNGSIQFLQDDGQKKNIDKGKIKRIWREYNGPSRRATTTIITMKNNDRFSGKFLNAALEIRANFITKTIRPQDINRLEFVENYQDSTEILLENGDLITGVLKQNQFRLAPDSVSELSVSRTKVKCIQFNAPKMVLKTFSAPGRPEKDSDGDGIPDYADICMNTPQGVSVKQDGCPRRSAIAKDGAETESGPVVAGRTQAHPDSRIELKNILFDFDRSDLKPQYYATLDEIALMLTQNPIAKAEIQGHTDNIGTAQYNQHLSEKRARVVKRYFVNKGVEQERLFPVGFGFRMNKTSNENETGRALNRRVEIALQN